MICIGTQRARPYDAQRDLLWRLQPQLEGNTGMDLFARGARLPFAFYEVADLGAMFAALDQARTQPAA